MVLGTPGQGPWPSLEDGRARGAQGALGAAHRLATPLRGPRRSPGPTPDGASLTNRTCLEIEGGPRARQCLRSVLGEPVRPLGASGPQARRPDASPTLGPLLLQIQVRRLRACLAQWEAALLAPQVRGHHAAEETATEGLVDGLRPSPGDPAASRPRVRPASRGMSPGQAWSPRSRGSWSVSCLDRPPNDLRDSPVPGP